MKCGAMATWFYMPSDSNYYYCDVCVPRGCSCNHVLDEDCNPILDDNGEFIQEVDDEGRFIPCCEYDFFEEGMEEEDV